MPLPVLIALWLAGASLWAFAAFGIDKTSARAGHRRIRESTLLQIAVCGGTPGAYAARAFFRHKTRKEPFSSRLHTIAIVQLAAAVGFAVFLMP